MLQQAYYEELKQSYNHKVYSNHTKALDSFPKNSLMDRFKSCVGHSAFRFRYVEESWLTINPHNYYFLLKYWRTSSTLLSVTYVASNLLFKTKLVIAKLEEE